MGIARDADTLYDENGEAINNPNWLDYSNPNYTRKDGEVGPTGGVGMPMMTRQSDSSITKATLTEGNITLNKGSTSTATTAKALGINTELKGANEKVEVS